MPYPNHSRVPEEDQNNAPSSANTAPEILNVYNELRLLWNQTYLEYETTNHMDEIVNLFSQPSDNWTIDRIVMVGIGFPPNMYQLAMIVRLAEIFWGELSTNGKLEMYSQEHPGSAVRGPNYASGCELFLRKLGFECLTATTKGSDYARPAQDLVTKTTLLYTPFLSSQSLLQLMDFTDPEILINVAVDRYKMSQGYTVKEVEDIVRDFKATHVWKHAPLYDKRCCDKETKSDGSD
ncbi:hypothetical protein EG328_003334 [Venturia inaequalis]|uniref:SRR1-like domain-containing protein n=1 Tax=Venturia inaequalis TaxID=5025 RepID=A0A8H3VKC2_VENIN|nr:hypothetical protein EG328_003334 [Venturia inaequalis]